MAIARMLIAAVVAIIVSTAVHAAEYQYLNASTNKRWQLDLLAFLQKNKPTPDNVSIAMTPAGDVHAYVVRASSPALLDRAASSTLPGRPSQPAPPGHHRRWHPEG